jgi:putative ABC transport system substrate-binding protein
MNPVRRRDLIGVFGGAAITLPILARAQQARIYKIGYLGVTSPSLESHQVEGFLQGLNNFGYVEGRNIVLEYRWAEGHYERMPALAAELVRLKPDILVTAGTPAAMAAKDATKTIPIVMAAAGDPVGVGIVASLAHPGGNVTGLSTMHAELEGKRIQLLRELVPGLSHLAVLWNPANPFDVMSWKEVQAAAAGLPLSLYSVEAETAEQLTRTFASTMSAKPDALILIADRVLLGQLTRIIDFAAEQRLPAMYPYDEFVRSGGLMSYSTNNLELFRYVSTLVDKILKGANPADIPVEQPTKFDLVINLKTAKALGLTVPALLLARADEVIE